VRVISRAPCAPAVLCGEALADERVDRFAHVLRLAAHAFFDLFTRARLVREKLEAGSAGANREQLAAKLEQARGYFHRRIRRRANALTGRERRRDVEHGAGDGEPRATTAEPARRPGRLAGRIRPGRQGREAPAAAPGARPSRFSCARRPSAAPHPARRMPIGIITSASSPAPSAAAMATAIAARTTATTMADTAPPSVSKNVRAIRRRSCQ
jgi:hypothetical protein